MSTCWKIWQQTSKSIKACNVLNTECKEMHWFSRSQEAENTCLLGQCTFSESGTYSFSPRSLNFTDQLLSNLTYVRCGKQHRRRWAMYITRQHCTCLELISDIGMHDWASLSLMSHDLLSVTMECQSDFQSKALWSLRVSESEEVQLCSPYPGSLHIDAQSNIHPTNTSYLAEEDSHNRVMHKSDQMYRRLLSPVNQYSRWQFDCCFGDIATLATLFAMC